MILNSLFTDTECHTNNDACGNFERRILCCVDQCVCVRQSSAAVVAGISWHKQCSVHYSKILSTHNIQRQRVINVRSLRLSFSYLPLCIERDSFVPNICTCNSRKPSNQMLMCMCTFFIYTRQLFERVWGRCNSTHKKIVDCIKKSGDFDAIYNPKRMIFCD